MTFVEDSSDRENRLDAAVAAYQQSREAGEDPNAADWIARYPDLAPDLESHFQMDGLVGWVALANVPLAPESGTHFGHYRMVRVIGRGGMGMVYEAENHATGQNVALKVLLSCVLPDPAHHARFNREMKVLATLDHPHILPIIDSGEHVGIPYFAMPLIEGVNLRAAVRQIRHARRSASPAMHGIAGPDRQYRLGGPGAEHARAVAAIGLQTATALDYAHKQGVIHRDLKPANLLLDTSGAVFVTDFGLAHASDRDQLTATGDLAGTLRYLPPERLRGWSDPRSDVYSLGLTLYELLTLRPAFDATDHSRLLRSIAQESPRRPRSINREIPRDLETIICTAIEREPSHRYPSAESMSVDLRRFLEGRPILTRRVSSLRRTWSWCRRNRLKATGIASLFISLGLILVLILYLERSRAEVAEAALRESEFQSAMFRIQQLKSSTPHHGGWWAEVESQVLEARKYRFDDPLRDHYVTSLVGLDLTVRNSFEDFGGSSVVFDSAGKRLLFGGLSPQEGRAPCAKLIDLPSGRVIRRSSLVGRGPVAFRRDGRPLQLSSVEGGRLALWDVENDQAVAYFECSRGTKLEALALSSDGSYVAASVTKGVASGEVIVWDTATRGVLLRYPRHSSALAFAPDGRLIGDGDVEGRIEIRTISTGERIASLFGRPHQIQALAFGRDPHCDQEGRHGWLLAEGGSFLQIWDVRRQILRVPVSETDVLVSGLAFSPDGSLLASSGRYGTRIWDVTTGRLILYGGGPGTPEATLAVAFSPGGDLLAAGGRQLYGPDRATVWHIDEDRGLRTLRGLTSQVASVSLNGRRGRVAAMATDYSVASWDLRTGQIRYVREPFGMPFSYNTSVRFSPDGDRLAVCVGNVIALWDAETGREACRWILPMGWFDDFALPPSGGLISIRLETRDARGSPIENGNPANPNVVRIRALRPDRSMVILGEISGFEGRVDGVYVSGDDRRFMVAGVRKGDSSDHQSLNAFDLPEGRPAWTIMFPRSSFWRLVPRPNEHDVALTFPGDQTTRLIDLQNGQETETWRADTFASGPGRIRLVQQEFQASRRSAQAPFQVEFTLQEGDSTILTNILHSLIDPHDLRAVFSQDGRHLVWSVRQGGLIVCDLDALRTRLRSIRNSTFNIPK